MLNMITLVLAVLWLLSLVIWLLPKSILNAIKQRKRESASNENEAERLDRIRNPSKYLGK